MSDEKVRVLESLASEIKIIYWRKDNEVLVSDDLIYLVRAALRNNESDFAYVSEKTEEGFMNAEVFVFGRYAVIEENWMPAIGAEKKRRENRVTLLKLAPPTQKKRDEK